MNRSLTVIHVVHWVKSGVGVVVKNLLAEHRRAGVNTCLVVLEGAGTSSEEFNDCAESVLLLSMRRHPLRSAAKLRDFMRSAGPNIIHSHSLTPMLLAKVMATHGSVLVRTVHSEYPYFTERTLRSWAKRLLERLVIRCQAEVIAVSPELLAPMRNALRPKRSRSIANGIRISAVSALARGTRDLNAANCTTIAAIGRLSYEKGFDLLLEAIALISRSGQHVRLIIAGTGDLEAALRRRAQALGIQERVDFRGFVADVPTLLAECDILVCSSRYEGFSLVLFEALAHAVPVVTTPIAVAARVIEQRDFGYVARAFTGPAIAEAIAACLDDMSASRAKAVKASDVIRQEYACARMAADYLQVYEEVISMGRQF